MKRWFKIKPKHWYQWINPFWWRRARRLEKVMEFCWHENHMDKRLEDCISDQMMYGNGIIDIPDPNGGKT